MRCNPFRELRAFWKSIVILLAPLLLCPLPIVFAGTENARAVKCAYVVCVMALYWIFEVLPLPVTALIPIFAFPLLDVLSTNDTAMTYLSADNFLFVGGLIIAIAVEEVNLHKRIALRVLLLMGSDPKAIMFGFMITTWFLSMWMSNTATTAMMLPIAIAVIDELIANRQANRETERSKARNSLRRDRVSESSPAIVITIEPVEDEKPEKEDLESSKIFEKTDKPTDNIHNYPAGDVRLAKAMLLCLCYSANIGGIGTLTGTVPNVVALGQLQESGVQGLTYANWMGANIPISLVFLILSFVWLVLTFFPMKDWITFGSKNTRLRDTLREHHRTLGSMSFGEYLVTVMYCILIVLWIFRDPKFTTGWQEPFHKSWVKDAVPAIAISVILFALPRDVPDFICCRRDKGEKPKNRKSILTWAAMKKFPWDVILLLGGGFAMAAGVNESGLSQKLAQILQENLSSRVSSVTFLAIVVIFITFFTEVTSNASTANIFIPILITTAEAMRIHPFYFVLPVAVACSFAFMLPVATPPNAIVFGSGILRIKDMMLTGFMLNWIGIGLTILNANTVIPAIFDLDVGNGTVAYTVTATTTVISTVAS